MQSLLTGVSQTLVGMNAYATHANRDIFGLDADDFNPERWLGHPETVAQMEQYQLPVREVLLLTPDCSS